MYEYEYCIIGFIDNYLLAAVKYHDVFRAELLGLSLFQDSSRVRKSVSVCLCLVGFHYTFLICYHTSIRTTVLVPGKKESI